MFTDPGPRESVVVARDRSRDRSRERQELVAHAQRDGTSVSSDAVEGAAGNAVVELPAFESWALLRQTAVGRLGVVVDDQPDIFPINYVVDRGSVVFRTAAGTKLAAAVGHWVALEIDGYDMDRGFAWSVVVKGEAKGVNGLYDLLEVMGLPLVPWQPALKPHFVRIEVDTISGRRFESIITMHQLRH